MREKVSGRSKQECPSCGMRNVDYEVLVILDDLDDPEFAWNTHPNSICFECSDCGEVWYE
jgi:uncharacterized Zn finger protein